MPLLALPIRSKFNGQFSIYRNRWADAPSIRSRTLFISGEGRERRERDVTSLDDNTKREKRRRKEEEDCNRADL